VSRDSPTPKVGIASRTARMFRRDTMRYATGDTSKIPREKFRQQLVTAVVVSVRFRILKVRPVEQSIPIVLPLVFNDTYFEAIHPWLRSGNVSMCLAVLSRLPNSATVSISSSPLGKIIIGTATTSASAGSRSDGWHCAAALKTVPSFDTRAAIW
jgi:hypothetical protein